MIYIVYYILRDFMIFFDRNEGIIICGHPVNGDHFYRFCEPESHFFFCIFSAQDLCNSADSQQ